VKALLGIAALAAVLVMGSGIQAATIHVPEEQPTIQAGIDAASHGDTVVVACGTYYEHDIMMKSGVCLRSETGEADCVIIDAQEQGRVLSCDGVDDQASIVGITLTGGFATGSVFPEVIGGGASCWYSSPTFANCTFHANSAAGAGGGVFFEESSSATLTNCMFTENEAGTFGGAVGGDAATLAITGCSFVENQAVLDGGAIHAEFWTAIDAAGCTFVANEAPGEGGALYVGWRCHVELASCTFSGNGAAAGGAMYADQDNIGSTVSHCVIAFGAGGEGISSFVGALVPSLTCCDIYGNTGGDWVGYIADQYGVDGNVSDDPMFCGDLNPEEPYTLHADSPCAPANNPACGLVGAWDVGCGFSAVEPTSWGTIKGMFR